MAYTKLSKTQLHKIVKSGGFSGRLLKPSLKTGLILIGNVLKPLAKSVLIPLGLTAAASAAVHKKMFVSGFTTLIISNEESRLLIKGESETIKNEAKKQKGGFRGMLLETLCANLLGNLLTCIGTIRAGSTEILSKST